MQKKMYAFNFFFILKVYTVNLYNLSNEPKMNWKGKKCWYFFFKYISNSHMNIWRKYLLLDTFTWLRGRCLEYRKVTSLYSKSRGASVKHVTTVISSIFMSVPLMNSSLCIFRCDYCERSKVLCLFVS